MHDPGERAELPHVTEINLMSLGVWGLMKAIHLVYWELDFYKLQCVRWTLKKNIKNKQIRKALIQQTFFVCLGDQSISSFNPHNYPVKKMFLWPLFPQDGD